MLNGRYEMSYGNKNDYFTRVLIDEMYMNICNGLNQSYFVLQ